MQEKNKITVFIAGKEYTLVGKESEDYIARVARYVDKKMQELILSTNMMTSSMAGILVALNVADDYFKALEALENEQSQDKVQEIAILTEELKKTSQQHYQLKNELEKMKIELTAAKVLLEANAKDKGGDSSGI